MQLFFSITGAFDMERFWFAIRVQLESYFRRLGHNIGTKLTLLVCVSILFFLFFHIFFQFIHRDLKVVPPQTRMAFSNSFAFVVLCFVAWFSGKHIYFSLKGKKSFGFYMRFIGENPRSIRFFQLIFTILLLNIIISPFWWVITGYFVIWSFPQKVYGFFFYTILTLFAFLVWNRVKKNRKDEMTQGNFPSKVNKQDAIYFWRLRKSFYRFPLNSLWFAVLISLMFMGLVSKSLESMILFQIMAYLQGLALGLLVCFEQSKSFKASWVERSLGVSHEVYSKSLFRITTYISVSGVVSYLLGFIMSLPFASLGFSWSLVLRIFSLCSLISVPVLLVNCIAFQLNPRSFHTLSLLLFLTSLFLTTAIVMNPLFVLAFPVIYSYAKESQKDRFHTI